MRQQDEHDLRAALLEEGDRHRPDRAAMLDRIARGRAEQTRRPLDRLFALARPAAAALAVAVLLVLGVAGVRFAGQGREVDDAPVAAPRPVAPAASVTPGPVVAEPGAAEPGDPEPGAADPDVTAPAPPKASASSGTTSRSPEPPETRDGWLDSSGVIDPHSNDGWTQSQVELTNDRTITALDVKVSVALTKDVVETGRWSSVPGNLLTMSSAREGRKLVFRFSLTKGATLAPGRYTFAAQFNHAAGKRSVKVDSYLANALCGDKDARVAGGFTAG